MCSVCAFLQFFNSRSLHNATNNCSWVSQNYMSYTMLRVCDAHYEWLRSTFGLCAKCRFPLPPCALALAPTLSSGWWFGTGRPGSSTTAGACCVASSGASRAVNRAAVGMAFQSPYPSHTHRNPIGIPMIIPIPTEPEVGLPFPHRQILAVCWVGILSVYF